MNSAPLALHKATICSSRSLVLSAISAHPTPPTPHPPCIHTVCACNLFGERGVGVNAIKCTLDSMCGEVYKRLFNKSSWEAAINKWVMRRWRHATFIAGRVSADDSIDLLCWHGLESTSRTAPHWQCARWHQFSRFKFLLYGRNFFFLCLCR